MIWIVAVEAVAVVMLSVCVVALVHSYGGLAARIEEGRIGRPRHARASVSETDAAPVQVATTQVVGVTPGGDGVVIPLVDAARDTMLAFLTSTCTSCRNLWHELANDAGDVLPTTMRLLIVAKGPEFESPSAIDALAPHGCDVVMSSDAWSDFGVPGSPYFVLVSAASGAVRGEGTALSWSRVLDLAGTSQGDLELEGGLRRDARKPLGDLQREADVDRLLLDAGIHPGDASLYPDPASRPQ